MKQLSELLREARQYVSDAGDDNETNSHSQALLVEIDRALAGGVAQGGTTKATGKMYFACESCEMGDPESPCHPRENIRVMPGGEWICESCYDEAPSWTYATRPSDPIDEDSEPRWHDFPELPVHGPVVVPLAEGTTGKEPAAWHCPACEAAVVVDDDYILPCDVKLPPATTITKGCTLSTLMAGLKLRETEWPEVTPEQAAAVQDLLKREFGSGEWVTVEAECSSPAANDSEVERCLDKLREQYRREMNAATDKAQQFAQTEEMDRVSEFSTEAERKREAFMALNQAIKLLDAAASGRSQPESRNMTETEERLVRRALVASGKNLEEPRG